jgi:hypothetical protein
MKIALLGIEYQLGKVNLKDARLDQLKELTGCPGKTYIQIDLILKILKFHNVGNVHYGEL